MCAHLASISQYGPHLTHVQSTRDGAGNGGGVVAIVGGLASEELATALGEGHHHRAAGLATEQRGERQRINMICTCTGDFKSFQSVNASPLNFLNLQCLLSFQHELVPQVLEAILSPPHDKEPCLPAFLSQPPMLQRGIS